MNDPNALAVLLVSGELCHYSLGHSPENNSIQKLIDTLAVEGDDEQGIEEVCPEVIATQDGVLYDVLLNGTSVGYFACRTFCKIPAFPNLEMPDLIAHGQDTDLDVPSLQEKHDYNCFVIPLFGVEQ
ncbi:MAG: hypothetical protein ACYSWO_22510 [Planctomycetota bacterium]|jgi:hypothetical protein